MSQNNEFIEDDGHRDMMELLEQLESEYIINSPENPADSECAENSQPADTDEVQMEMHSDNKLSEDNIDHELIRKVNEKMQEVAILKQNYNELAIQIDEFEKLFTNESTSPNESTTGSGQVPIPENKPVANEDIVLVSEAIAKFAMELSLPNESQNSALQQIINTALLPRFPIMFAMEPTIKPMAPAPQIKIHLRNNQVALTWSMLEEDLSAYEPVLTYQVYCCKETRLPPTPANWWKLTDLTALPLPMTYVVDGFTAGKYYFAVRGIDIQMRIGLFSSPVPVIFDVSGIKLVA